MVKSTNTRITITISKKQYKWLENLCQEKGMKFSKLISWMLYQKTNDVEHTKNLLENPKEELDQIENDEDYVKTQEEWDNGVKHFGIDLMKQLYPKGIKINEKN